MSWSIEQSRQLYAIKGWGAGYFDIGANGQVVVYPQGNTGKASIDTHVIAQSIQDHGLELPVLVRFIDILEHRVKQLFDCFSKACAQFDYQGNYLPVYPIKVNQQKTVIDGILQTNAGQVGLEAGSRAELLAIIALSCGGPVICNGYKDRHYIRLALIALRMGVSAYLVIEKLSELQAVFEEAEKLAVEPSLGVRVRLSNVGDNRWQNSGGEKSKFGLGASDLLSLVKQLDQRNSLHCLNMMHFHIGSQVTSLESFASALQEAGRFHAELHRLGARIRTLDVGGGLAVDYEGRGTTDFCSMNYSIEAYAETIVRCIKQTCAVNQIPEPDILTESGRAMTAHHSMLITNVVEVERLFHSPVDDQPIDNDSGQLSLSAQQLLTRLRHAHADFKEDKIGLSDLAIAESACYAQLQMLREQINTAGPENETLLNEKLADKVFCNFSLFQSMPDVWAFQQRFPIMPLSRLDERPTRRAVIQDLTCDSDGCINQYVEQQGIEKTLPLHDIADHQPYYLGFFLLGAYQEILGDMHNLFGDTDAINIHLDEQGHSHYYSPDKGDSIADLLRYVHIEPEQLLEHLQLKLDNAGLDKTLKKEFEIMFNATLRAGTYLEQSS